MFKNILFLSAITLLSACSSRSIVNLPGITEPPAIQFENLYLRGVFNWWEANSSYKLKEGKRGWYVDVDLIADGQPYDFRLSDAFWTPNQTCGAKYLGQVVLLQDPLYLVCGKESENLQFTPDESGIYRFTFIPASGGEVMLSVTQK